MKRRIKIAALIVGLLVFLVLMMLAWVVYTEAGLRFAVAHGLEDVYGARLRSGLSGGPTHLLVADP